MMYSTIQTTSLLNVQDSKSFISPWGKLSFLVIILHEYNLPIESPWCSTYSCSLLLFWMFCSFTGRRKEERRESLPCGDLCADSEAEDSRRPSFLRMVSLGKLKRESMSDKASQEAEEETVEEEPVVETREPLSGNKWGNIRWKIIYTTKLCLQVMCPRRIQHSSLTLENFGHPGQASAAFPLSPRQVCQTCLMKFRGPQIPESLGSITTRLWNQEMTALPSAPGSFGQTFNQATVHRLHRELH